MFVGVLDVQRLQRHPEREGVRRRPWLMVVCHCLRINDRVISRFVEDPSVTTDDITRECGAGGRCGGCRPAIDALLATTRAEHDAISTIETAVVAPRLRRLVSAA